MSCCDSPASQHSTTYSVVSDVMAVCFPPLHRDLVMITLRQLDPQGCSQRRYKKLCRRMYQSKVCWMLMYDYKNCALYFIGKPASIVMFFWSRDLISCGTVMDTTSLNHMDSLSMGALTGKNIRVLESSFMVSLNRYPRRVLWLKVGTSNNNPSMIANYFLTCVKELGG